MSVTVRATIKEVVILLYFTLNTCLFLNHYSIVKLFPKYLFDWPDIAARNRTARLVVLIFNFLKLLSF